MCNKIFHRHIHELEREPEKISKKRMEYSCCKSSISCSFSSFRKHSFLFSCFVILSAPSALVASDDGKFTPRFTARIKNYSHLICFYHRKIVKFSSSRVISCSFRWDCCAKVESEKGLTTQNCLAYCLTSTMLAVVRVQLSVHRCRHCCWNSEQKNKKNLDAI